MPLEAAIPRDEAARVAGELADTLERMGVPIARRVERLRARPGDGDHAPRGRRPARARPLRSRSAWYERGLRSLGIVWSRPNAFGEGVPFRFPASPDTGPGLTDAGRKLVMECNRLGILVDVSHLNEAGFWDVARGSLAPLVATHSNAHALSASTRNLTDEQLDAIGRTDGVVGINFAIGFLREDGHTQADTAARRDRAAHRLHRRADRRSTRSRSAPTSRARRCRPSSAAWTGLPRLVEALRARGYDDEALAKITHGNWLRVLGQTWRRWGRYFDMAGDDARPTLLDAVSPVRRARASPSTSAPAPAATRPSCCAAAGA